LTLFLEKRIVIWCHLAGGEDEGWWQSFSFVAAWMTHRLTRAAPLLINSNLKREGPAWSDEKNLRVGGEGPPKLPCC